MIQSPHAGLPSVLICMGQPNHALAKNLQNYSGQGTAAALAAALAAAGNKRKSNLN